METNVGTKHVPCITQIFSARRKVIIYRNICNQNCIYFRTVNFQYAKVLYTSYQAKITTLAEPDITLICKSLKRVSFSGKAPTENETENASEHLNIGTTLFELYLIIQRFVV